MIPGDSAELLVTPDVVELAAGETQAVTVQVTDAAYAWDISPDLGFVDADVRFFARTVGQDTLRLTADAVSTELPVVVTPGPLARLPASSCNRNRWKRPPAAGQTLRR